MRKRNMAFSVILTSGSLILLFLLTSHGKLSYIAKFENLKRNSWDTLRMLALKKHLAILGLFLNSFLIWSVVFARGVPWLKTLEVPYVSFSNNEMKY